MTALRIAIKPMAWARREIMIKLSDCKRTFLTLLLATLISSLTLLLASNEFYIIFISKIIPVNCKILDLGDMFD